MSSLNPRGRKTHANDQKIPWPVNTKGFLRWLERLALAVEDPFNRLAGSLKINIFYHTDTIAVFLWFIVALTGIYITLFYQFGFEGSYNAVAKIESQFVARTIRAIHRYVSGSAVIITLLHAYRTFFMDRFRGPRWLAWVSGIGMGIFLWFDAITGYWLVWDQRAQVINNTFISFLNRYFGNSGDRLALHLIEANQTDGSWLVMFWILTAHILLFGVAALFFWYHIVRLNKPKLFPPRHWMISTGLVMVIASALFPVGMLPRASFSFLPEQVELDPFFLFYFPVELDGGFANIFWISIVSITLILLAIPWIIRRRKPAPVKVIDDACIGCTLCAVDCPYNALEMIERKNGKGSKMIALAHPDMCVSCGICIGSCAYDAIEVGELNAKAMQEATNLLLEQAKENAPEKDVKIVFTCERHAAHGARPFIEMEAGLQESETRVVTIPLPCVGAAPPDLIGNIYKAGASEVQMIGCPPEDCAQRRGNTWTEARLERERKPLLRTSFKDALISFSWQPPNLFSKAVKKEDKEPKELTWRNYTPVFSLLIILLIVQILFTNLRFIPYTEPQAKVQLIAQDLPRALGKQVSILGENSEIKVVLLVNDEVHLSQSFTAASLTDKKSLAFFEEITLLPGDYSFEIKAYAEELTPKQWTLAIREITLNDRDIYPITLVAPGLAY